MKTHRNFLIAILVLLTQVNSQPSNIMCGDETPNTGTIDPRTHEVNALMIYVSFPEQNQPYLIPNYVNDVESNVWDYYNEMSEGDHELVITTFRRPVPNQNYTYVADNNMSYYQNINNGKGILNTEIFWKVYNDNNNAFNDIDVIFMNYTDEFFPSYSGVANLGTISFPYYNGVGTTQEELGSQNNLEWHIAHEYGHLLNMSHHTEGIYCQMDGNSWLEQIGTRPYCTSHLIYKGWIDNNHVIEVNVNMFDVQIQDIRNSGYVYKIPVSNTEYFLIENHQRTGYDMDYPGTGLLVWHRKYGQQTDLETADGRFNWQEEYCAEDYHFSYPFVQLNGNANSGKDELDLRKVECCSNGNLITRTHLDITGDIEDMFNMQTSTLFAPWTNPSSKDNNGNFTDIMVKVKSQQGSTIIADLFINAPPRTPKQFRITGGPGDNPTAQWQLNNEPDIAGYRVYRKLDGQNNFVLIYTANTSETNYTDTEVTINRFSPAQAYYYITAFDNNQNESEPTIDRWVSYNPWKTTLSLTNATDYFPLHIGDKWQYRIITDNSTTYQTKRVIGDTVINSKRYFETTFDFFPWARIDSSENIVYAKGDLTTDSCQNEEMDYFKLFLVDSGSGTTTNCNNSWVNYENGRMYSSLLDDTTGIIEYEWSDLIEHTYRLTKQLGITYFYYTEGSSGYGELEAAEINGVTYGDFVGIDDGSPIPSSFALHPAFPNPFNPVTTIKYELSANTNINLIIYNIMGKQVQTLTSGNKKAGLHTVIWDGTNSRNEPVSTGMYLVQLTTPNSVHTQKIVLMK